MQKILAELEKSLQSQYEELIGMRAIVLTYEHTVEGALLMGLKVKPLPFTIKEAKSLKRRGPSLKTNEEIQVGIQVKVLDMLTGTVEMRYGDITNKFYGQRRPLVRSTLKSMVADGAIYERKGSKNGKYYSLNGVLNAAPSPTQTPATTR